MKYIFFISLIFWCSISMCSVKISQEQFDNIFIIKEEISKRYPDFGINGSKDDLKVQGMSDDEFLKELNKINFKKIKSDKDDANKIIKETISEKLINLGFTQDEIDIILK